MRGTNPCLMTNLLYYLDYLLDGRFLVDDACFSEVIKFNFYSGKRLWRSSPR